MLTGCCNLMQMLHQHAILASSGWKERIPTSISLSHCDTYNQHHGFSGVSTNPVYRLVTVSFTVTAHPIKPCLLITLQVTICRCSCSWHSQVDVALVPLPPCTQHLKLLHGLHFKFQLPPPLSTRVGYPFNILHHSCISKVSSHIFLVLPVGQLSIQSHFMFAR